MSDHDCPTCGDTFGPRRGLGVHHSSVHGERLPNRECAHCEECFYSEYDKKYCSEECRDTAVSYEGENNPNYRGGKESTECELCGDMFEFYPSEKEGLYCAECVETEQWREMPPLDGRANPRWKGGQMTLEYEMCDATMERHPSNVNGEVTVCGKECLGDWLSEEFTGEGHPNWTGGGVGNYGQGWNRVRRQALERDDHTCQVCGATAADIGRNPDVHHIVPVRVFVHAEEADRTDAHDVDNVVALCPSCHRQAEFGVIPREELWEEIAMDQRARTRLRVA